MSDATATIRPDEAAHFGALAADWWDPKGSSAMLHRLNPVRLGFIRGAIDRHWGGDIESASPLAGKAAEGLEKEAGIPSRTLASWELGWQQGRRRLDDKTVFVLDEAGMVSSRQMATFVEAVTRSGAKLILVGDAEQLQPIEAGAAFRSLADRVGYAALGTQFPAIVTRCMTRLSR